jgi:hypothetical protein
VNLIEEPTLLPSILTPILMANISNSSKSKPKIPNSTHLLPTSIYRRKIRRFYPKIFHKSIIKPLISMEEIIHKEEITVEPFPSS